MFGRQAVNQCPGRNSNKKKDILVSEEDFQLRKSVPPTDKQMSRLSKNLSSNWL
jgi:hypothetical protein